MWPRLVLTELANRFEPSILEGHIGRTPLRRLTTPQGIGRTVVSLATQITAVTGVIIRSTPGEA
jgi:hypothetical protein